MLRLLHALFQCNVVGLRVQILLCHVSQDGDELMTMRIAFMGLGRMGFPMAGHLAATGHDVVVYNRTPERATQWQSALRRRYRNHGTYPARLCPRLCGRVLLSRQR